jgi:hypothetical protein
MSILLLEMKRVIKSRMTWILLVIAIALSVIISLSVVSYAEYTYVDKNGNEATISGMEAIRANKKQLQPYEGKITEAKLKNVLINAHDFYKKYGENYDFKTYHDNLAPIESFMQMLYKIYPRTGGALEALNKVKPDEITNFYQQRIGALEDQLAVQYPGNKNVIQQAKKINEKVKTPFIFQYGYGSDASDNLEILIFLLVLICAMIVSPIFSADYHNGADDILRCTKHGRGRLSIIKILSALIITFAMSAVCTLIFVLIVNTAYGWGSLQTSAQVLTSALSIAPFSVGQEQILTIAEGLLMVLAVVCLTLFISAKSQNPTTALIIAIAFCILPLILNGISEGNVINLITCLLPAGGSSMLHSFYYQLNKTVFIQMGPFSVWAPYLMLGAAIIEIPLFFILSVRAYCKHQAA